MPLLILAFVIADLLSIAYPFIAYHLYREWDHYRGTVEDDYAQRCLWGAIALLLFILLGRFLIKALLSKSRKGEDEPQMFDTNKRTPSNAQMAALSTWSTMEGKTVSQSSLCTG